MERAGRIELTVDALAAALYAAATGWIVLHLGATMMFAIAAAAVALSGCFYGLRAIVPQPRKFNVGDFSLAGEVFAPEELLLTEIYSVPEAPKAAETRWNPRDARVVRLFDPANMPAGEFDADDPGNADVGKGTTPPDASQALYDALAQLRRSIR